MHIQTNLPFAFSCVGERSVNQDSLYPPVHKADEQAQLFMVCDGIGGADKGEVASQLLCDGIAGYAASMGDPILDVVHMQSALDQVYAAYQAYLQQHPLVSRMGSTLALLQLHHQGASVVHIGDSRVYQLRDGEIVFQTKDHKQVNDMVDAGIINEQQARTHPWRNRLSRAVVISADESNQNITRSTPDVVILTDVKAGDYFFLCTDGVLEQIDEAILARILSDKSPDQAKLEAFLALCEGKTKDNYSAYLVGINQVTQSKTITETNFVS